MSSLAVASRDGLALEAALEGPADARAAAVLCHPHPGMGGTMNAPLLLALRDGLTQRGWAVLRFNFRGIGASEGKASLGVAEAADALGAVDAARRHHPGAPVAIAGWSFGGAVAVRAAVDDDALVGCAAIAPAVTPKPGITAGLPAAEELDLGVPLLFVLAARDEVVDPEDSRAWIRPVEAATVVEIRGANHFFWNRYDELTQVVAGWLEDRLD